MSVNYVDEAGNPIKKSVEDTPESNVDTAYDTTSQTENHWKRWEITYSQK